MLSSPCVRIGRAHDNDIVIDDLRVSRYHLELRWQAELEHFLAVDLNSSGGTLLNGHPIRQCTLKAGDVLLLGGSAELIYGEAQATADNL
jgi:pSer/pThr/pTyr-binding forkhead associated (FHA) protein